MKGRLKGRSPFRIHLSPPSYSGVVAKGSFRGAKPLSKVSSPSPSKESQREAKPLLYNQFPLPYEGRGIKGVG